MKFISVLQSEAFDEDVMVVTTFPNSKICGTPQVDPVWTHHWVVLTTITPVLIVDYEAVAGEWVWCIEVINLEHAPNAAELHLLTDTGIVVVLVIKSLRVLTVSISKTLLKTLDHCLKALYLNHALLHVAYDAAQLAEGVVNSFEVFTV
jgi:hypothetical protein